MTASASAIQPSRTRLSAPNGQGSPARNAANRNPTTATSTAYWHTRRGPAAVVSRRSMPARISTGAPAVASVSSSRARRRGRGWGSGRSPARRTGRAPRRRARRPRRQPLRLQRRVPQDRAVHRAVRAGRSLAGDRDVAELGADQHPARRDGIPACAASQRRRRTRSARVRSVVCICSSRILDDARPVGARRSFSSRAARTRRSARRAAAVRTSVSADEVHAGDVHARLGVDDQVVGRDRRGDAAAVLQEVALGAGPQQPREPVPGVLLRRHVQRRLVGEHVLVARGVEGDDEQVVVQRDVEQLEELGEGVLVLVQHRQRDAPGTARPAPRRPRPRRGRGGPTCGRWRSVTRMSIACCSSHSASGTRCSSRCSSESVVVPGRLSRMPRSRRNRPAASSRPHSSWVSRGRRAPLGSQMSTGAVLRRSTRATGTHTSSAPCSPPAARRRAAQVPGQHRGPPLPLVQHRQADVDLGGPAGDPVVGDGQRLAHPADVVEAQRGVQERQPDRGADRVLARRSARYRDAHDRMAQRSAALHGLYLPETPVAGFGYRSDQPLVKLPPTLRRPHRRRRE